MDVHPTTWLSPTYDGVEPIGRLRTGRPDARAASQLTGIAGGGGEGWGGNAGGAGDDGTEGAGRRGVGVVYGGWGGADGGRELGGLGETSM